MLTFREFILERENNEVIGFANAGGRIGQYDKFSIPGSNVGFACGGGSPNQYNDDIKENLNPKDDNPISIHDTNTIFTDPERENKGLGSDRNHPRHLDIENHHNKPFVEPSNTTEHVKTVQKLLPIVDKKKKYYDTTDAYTTNSYNLNRTLLKHNDDKTRPPNKIAANLDKSKNPEENQQVHLSALDNLIDKHKTSESMTVYSGLHIDPYSTQNLGKIVKLPAYTSTSVNPHVAKDFGANFRHRLHGSNEDQFIKHMIRLELPKDHPHLLTDHGSHFPGQSEVILPRNTRLQIGRNPTHIIKGNFANHFNGKHNPDADDTIHYIWNARILPHKD